MIAECDCADRGLGVFNIQLQSQRAGCRLRADETATLGCHLMLSLSVVRCSARLSVAWRAGVQLDAGLVIPCLDQGGANWP